MKNSQLIYKLQELFKLFTVTVRIFIACKRETVMKETQTDIACLILCGGASKRFGGTNKLLLCHEGRTFLSLIAEAFGETGRILLSADKKERFAKLGFPVIEDRYPGCGPLGGIVSALETCSEEAVFVAACDMPFITKESVRRLLDAYFRNGGIVLAEGSAGIEPLFGIYPNTVLPEAKSMLTRGDLKLRSLYASCGGTSVRFEDADSVFININTPADYRRFVRPGS